MSQLYKIAVRIPLREVLAGEGIEYILQRDGWHIAATTATLGVLFHLTFLKPFEVEQFMYKLIALGFLSLFALVPVHVLAGFTASAATTRVALIASCFIAGVFSSITVYRLAFHRLRHFPGPFGAKLSKFYSVYLAARKVQYHKDVARMHRQYGDFIRTGPRELCIVRKSAVPLIYGPNTECRKSTWYTQVNADGQKVSMNMTRNVNEYRRRRKVWDRGFAIKVLNGYMPRIRAKCDLFVAQLYKAQRPLDVSAWSMYLAFDIMGEAGFSKDFGGVSKGVEHAAIKGVHDSMSLIGIVSHVPWLFNIGTRIPGALAGYAPFIRWCADEIENKKKAWKPDQLPDDVASWLVKAVEEKDISAAPSDLALHEDSRLMIVAGSETTATTLAQTLFHLAKYPHILRKLQSQIDAAMPSTEDWEYEKARSITYIDDIVHETLRLKPALLTGVYRQTPPQGLQVDEQYIPGDTTVFVPMQVIHTDDRYWKQAAEFIPERFGEKRVEMETDAAPFFPFNQGMHLCPGRNMAMMSLRIAISKIAQHFDVSFAPGETGAEFDQGPQETFTTTLPPLKLQFKPRAR